MSIGEINQKNVGRIAERIVANEVEFRGFRVTDLNKEGTSASADLLAVKGDRILQLQVKGATQSDKWWWVQYGVCTDEIIANPKSPMFNRHLSFYKADVVVLVAVLSPKEYSCVILPVEDAEKAAQINLDREFRTLTRKGTPHKPHKVWVHLDHIPTLKESVRAALLTKEVEILKRFRDNWGVLEGISSSASAAVGAR